MRQITDYHRQVIHVFALCGPMTKYQFADLTGFLPESVKGAIHKLIPLGFIEKAGNGIGRRRPLSVFRWTGKDYGEKPDMPSLDRTLAMRVAVQAIDAMCRVGRA